MAIDPNNFSRIVRLEEENQFLSEKLHEVEGMVMQFMKAAGYPDHLQPPVSNEAAQFCQAQFDSPESPDYVYAQNPWNFDGPVGAHNPNLPQDGQRVVVQHNFAAPMPPDGQRVVVQHNFAAPMPMDGQRVVVQHNFAAPMPLNGQQVIVQPNFPASMSTDGYHVLVQPNFPAPMHLDSPASPEEVCRPSAQVFGPNDTPASPDTTPAASVNYSVPLDGDYSSDGHLDEISQSTLDQEFGIE